MKNVGFLMEGSSTWQGLEVHSHVGPTAVAAMDMRSGHHGRMALYSHNVPLFWASMLKDHSGIWLVFNTEHPQSEGLLPAVTSRDVASMWRSVSQAWTSEGGLFTQTSSAERFREDLG
ncbi:hypothetical protein [Candidatus Symbiopectobacterium sp. NZEC135]|uniref:hypothetical protein n=1 Tax=Candidatus Symbiopectobacterium sp. NZEC135 TaxID=2820471 RepID=UPI0022272D87|nr:hypothetical protein [Candidatus Symbiopectobacterium sp. NZEC135]MCW2478105.1 hypothetical protein [Candidatus Symbiopectobacterium sp. NZEC135]